MEPPDVGDAHRRPGMVRLLSGLRLSVTQRAQSMIPLRKIPMKGWGRLTRAEWFTQNLWFLAGIPAARVGYGRGWLTTSRLKRHRRLERPIRIALLEYHTGEPHFGPITAYWINERSRICTAAVNQGIERADVLWIYSQDPLTPGVRERIQVAVAGARSDVRILNAPDHYNAYHDDGCFERLEAAGVSVPDRGFGEADLGRTPVIYKMTGLQAAPKTLETWQGPRPGYQAFRFIDSRETDGLYRRYRTFYFVGAVRPSKLMICEHWNVCLKNRPRLEIGFEMTRDEIRQVRLIAETLGLDYFAVDYLRRRDDGRAFFTDVNVYPTITSLSKTGRERGYYGMWHTFDTRPRLGVPEPGGRPFNEVFDDALRHFVDRKRFPDDPDALN